MSKPLVSIIIATHNGMDFMAKCLDSIRAQDYAPCEIVVVDNASTDGLAGFVSANFPRVVLIRSEENLGYGGGNNLGVESASGQLLLFLNHDTVVTPTFLSELVNVLEANPDIGIAQSRIMIAKDPSLVDSVGAYLTKTGIWYHPSHGEPYSGHDLDPLDILGACGTCMIVRRSVFGSLGGFDRDFFIYFDDADFTWRARLAGTRVVVVPRSVICHWGGGTTLRMPSVLTVYHSFKNRLCSLLKLLSPFDLITVIPIHLLFCLAAVFVYMARGKFENGISILQALAWNVTHVNQTLVKRRAARGASLSVGYRGYGDMVRPLPFAYLAKTSAGYFAKW